MFQGLLRDMRMSVVTRMFTYRPAQEVGVGQATSAGFILSDDVGSGTPPSEQDEAQEPPKKKKRRRRRRR
jgi:hypothetical protein